MVPDFGDSTSIYIIGTPKLLPSSTNPSITSSGHRSPHSSGIHRPVAVPMVSPIKEESDAIGDMAAIKPRPGVRKEAPPVSQVLKMIVLGDASVGKTAIIQRFVNGSFQLLPYKPTVGADFYSQKLEFTSKATGDTIFLTLQIWDTAGQERYKSLASSFYRGADICVIVEDATRSVPIETVAQWHEDFLRHATPFEPETFPFIFLLNKADLLSDSEAISLESTWQKTVANKFNVPRSRAALVSAKTGENVEEALFLGAKVGAQRALYSNNQIRAQRGGLLPPSQGGLIINLNNQMRNPDDDGCLSQC
jgi:Ras-related protein Rab-7A